jgi:hypothetical protein
LFSLADGTCLNGDFAVRTFPVREEDGEIVVDAQSQTSGSRLAPVVKVDHDGMSW